MTRYIINSPPTWELQKRSNQIKNGHSPLKTMATFMCKQPEYTKLNEVKVTGNYKMANIVVPFCNYFFRMSHTIVNINALTRITVTPLYEHSAPDFRLILPLLLLTFDMS